MVDDPVQIAPWPEDGVALDAVVDAFLEAFDLEPGGDGRRTVRERFARHAGYPGFRGLVARHVGRHGDRVAGLAYGYRSAPGQVYHDKLRAALGEALSGLWLADCFEFVELAVVPGLRRRGLASRLHDALLANLPCRTAVLTTEAANAPARNLYERRGWRVIHADFRPFPGSAAYVIMGLQLPAANPGARAETAGDPAP